VAIEPARTDDWQADYRPSDYPPFAVTVDIVVLTLVERVLHILLIRRGTPPYEGRWALPGGFVDIGESVPAAAVREAREETALEVELTALLGVYSEPGRDPRGHTASVVYIGSAAGDPRAQDDAKTVRVVSLDELPADLAFDHALILGDYRRYRERGEAPPPWSGAKSRRFR